MIAHLTAADAPTYALCGKHFDDADAKFYAATTNPNRTTCDACRVAFDA